jgi:hypothetical protein
MQKKQQLPIFSIKSAKVESIVAEKTIKIDDIENLIGNMIAYKNSGKHIIEYAKESQVVKIMQLLFKVFPSV